MQTPSHSKLQQRKRKTRLKALLWAIGLLGVIVIGILTNQLMRNAVETLAMRTTSWTCSDIQIIAGVELSADSILELSGCTTKSPLASYSTDIIAARLLQSPWIKNAEVTRYPPNTLKIHVTERTGIALVHDGSQLALSEDYVLLPCADKSWRNTLPWLSTDVPFARQVGPMSERDPLYPVARELVRVRSLTPDVASNFAEMYRVNGTWGAVLMNPVLTLSLSPEVSTENWLALNELLMTPKFQDKVESNAVVDLRLPGYVTLHLPGTQAEDS